MKKIVKQALAGALVLLCIGCKVRIEVPEGGQVISSSGDYDCRLLTADAVIRPAHAVGEEEEGFHCDFVIEDTSFNETFTAVPSSGWEFAGWRNRKPGEYLYGGFESAQVWLTTIGFDANELLMTILQSDQVYYLEPVFEKVEPSGAGTDCSNLGGSFDRIQSLIFEGYNCTNSACHSGNNPAGALDLTAGKSFDNLYRVDAAANLPVSQQLVYPGEQKLSFLYTKLEAATNAILLPNGAGLPMPIGGAPLTTDHLEAMRLWIRNGAPESANVDGVATLLGCDQATAPQSNKIDPPAPPAPGEGVQFISGPWAVLPESENEVCFATYYDLEQTPELLPDWALTPCSDPVYNDYDGVCMATNTRTLTQDPQSHHSIINVYTGSASPFEPAWGDWQCLNGPNKGSTCDPTRIGEPVASGGADCGGDRFVCGTQARKSIACRGWGPTDLRTHQVSMGGAQAPVSQNILAEGVYGVLPARGIIVWNSHAFNLSTEETTVEQYNNILFAPESERRYRSRAIFDAKDIFVANVPPYEQRTYCSTTTLPVGSRLTQLGSHAHKRGILWQTWLPPQDPNCKVSSDCKPNAEAPDYLSRVYNDPLQVDYEPPLEYDSSKLENRTLKFCVTYDNGKDFPDLLKRNSTSVGTTCEGNAYCVAGPTPGKACGSDDSLCGSNGSCDACVVRGGVTTEDEMFLMLGGFYIVPADERN